MVEKTELINISCPVCGTTMVSTYKGRDIKGILQHKCGKCKRYWNVDYTNRTIIWVKGKEADELVKNWQLNLSTGYSIPIWK